MFACGHFTAARRCALPPPAAASRRPTAICERQPHQHTCLRQGEGRKCVHAAAAVQQRQRQRVAAAASSSTGQPHQQHGGCPAWLGVTAQPPRSPAPRRAHPNAPKGRAVAHTQRCSQRRRTGGGLGAAGAPRGNTEHGVPAGQAALCKQGAPRVALARVCMILGVTCKQHTEPGTRAQRRSLCRRGSRQGAAPPVGGWRPHRRRRAQQHAHDVRRWPTAARAIWRQEQKDSRSPAHIWSLVCQSTSVML